MGGTFIQGYYDDEVGYSISVNTDGNGNLRLVNSDSGTPYPGPILGAARTYTFWVKPEEAIFQTLIYSGGPANGEVFSVQMQANRILRVTDNNQNTVLMEDMPLDIGSWNHIAVSVPEQNTMRSISLYKNGVSSVETFTGSDTFINTASNVVDFFPKFKGIVSDIRYFDYDLCNGEVESVFNDRQITLSIDEALKKDTKSIVVYPTIVSDNVNFSKPVTSIKVYNLLGNTLFSKDNTNLMDFNVSNLPSGFYILKINKVQSAKIYKR